MDVCQWLFSKGRLERHHVIAADEIGRIWRAVNRSSYAVSNLRERVDFDHQKLDMIDRLGAHQEFLFLHRYRRWFEQLSNKGLRVELSDRKVFIAAPVPAILAMIVSNEGTAQVEKRLRLRRGCARFLLHDGLGLYCRIAGIRPERRR